MSSSSIECRQCKAPLLIPAELEGKRIQCPRCQAEVIVPMAAVPLAAIAPVPMASYAPTSAPRTASGGEIKSKRMEAAIFALLLGTIGVHKFMTDRRHEGKVMLIASCCIFGIFVMGPIALIEGIKYLCMDDAEFVQTYQIEKKGWF